MPRATPKTRYYPRVGVLACGPFRGCSDATDPTTAQPDLARSLRNMMRSTGPTGSGQLGRPGTSPMGDPLGTKVQAGAQTWTDINGVHQTVAVVDGQVWTYDWGTDVWTLSISTANLATASAALSTTARVALVPFADRLVISDGVNFALWWDGTTGAGGIIELPVKFYGPPTVYYSKLAGIDATNRHTLFWSEEGDATLGYYVTVGPYTYANAWDNPGGYTEPLTAVCGTNDGLYVFRERISLAILGAMSADFQTAGTRANLSPEIGTNSPWGVREITQGVFLVDADAQPWLMKIGAIAPLPLWKDCQQTLRDVPRLSMVNATVIYDETTSNVVLGLASSGALNPLKWLAFNADDLQYNGFWYGWAAAASAGQVIDQFGVKRWSHADLLGGQILAHGSPQAGPLTDYVSGGKVTMNHEVIGPYLGYDPLQEFFVNQGEFGFTQGTEATITYETSRGFGSSAVITLSSGSGGGFFFDVSHFDVDSFGYPVVSSQGTIGWAGRGRYVSPIVRHSKFNDPFGMDVMRVRIGYTPGNPRQP